MRICITGQGVVCPGSVTVDDLMAGLWAGRSAITGLPALPEYGLEPMACGVCDDVTAIEGVAPHQLRGLDRVSVFSLGAARQALAQADAAGALPRANMPLVWGCSMGGLGTLDEAYQDLIALNKRRLRPTTVPYAMPSAPAFHVAHHLGVRGPASTVTVACASSAVAIIQGCRLIATDEADAVLVGGTEAMNRPATRRAWQMTQSVCDAEPDHPEQSCRPFSARRHGFALAEGAAALVLESEASARSRGATVLGWVRGWGHTTDAGHISRPDTSAQVAAMSQALAHAGVAVGAVSYLNAHGTATAAGDPSEAQAIHTVFGDGVTVGSTKALHGHLIGAAGALEAIVTIESLRAGRLPGNPHSHPLDESAAALNIPPETVELAADAPRIGVSNSFAFGGVNVALVLEAAHG